MKRPVKTRNDEKANKRKHSTEELVNDPSLRFCGYRPFEAIYSDSHGCEMRFVRYHDDAHVVLATINGMAETGGVFSVLSIRRASVQEGYSARLSEMDRQGILAEQKLSRISKKTGKRN